MHGSEIKLLFEISFDDIQTLEYFSSPSTGVYENLPEDHIFCVQSKLSANNRRLRHHIAISMFLETDQSNQSTAVATTS